MVKEVVLKILIVLYDEFDYMRDQNSEFSLCPTENKIHDPYYGVNPTL